MKKSGINLKPNSLISRDLKPISKYDLKNSLSARTIDTKFLFKNDQIKELSKFAANLQSRDVSHLRDKQLSQLPRLTSTLPTDFSVLQQLYYSSDSFGMPISLSSQNLASSHTCKKQSCVEKVLSTHNSASIFPEDFTPDLLDRINLGNPSGRQDIKNLQNWLNYMKETTLENLKFENEVWSNELIEKAEIVYVMAGKEIVRQVTVQCIERGEVLKEILWFFSTIFKHQQIAFEKKLTENLEKIQKEVDEKVYKHARQIAQYEIHMKKKSEKIEGLKKHCAEVEENLKLAHENLLKFQDSAKNHELKGFIFNNKLNNPTVHKISMKRAKTYAKNEGLLQKVEVKVRSEDPETIKEQTENNDDPEKDLKNSEVSAKTQENEVINSEKNEAEEEENLEGPNDKILQTEEVTPECLEESTQTEVKSRGQKFHFDFRRINNENKAKSVAFSMTPYESIQIIPLKTHLELLPNALVSESSSRSHSIQKSRSGSVMLLNSSIDKQLQIPQLDIVNNEKHSESPLDKSFKSDANSKRRSSMMSPVSEKNFIVKSRNSPLPQINEKIEKNEGINNRKFSISINEGKNSEDDLILQNVISKKRIYEEISQSLKEKKNEIGTINAEIESKQASLNALNRELQLKHLELQANSKGSSDLKRLILEKIEGIKEEKDVKNKKNSVRLDVNGLNIEIDATLEELIPKNLDIASWKAGFNAGFEKGHSIGMNEGEVLGIELGEDQGYVKSIVEIKKNGKIVEENSFESGKNSGHSEDEIDNNEDFKGFISSNEENFREKEEKIEIRGKTERETKRKKRFSQEKTTQKELLSIVPEKFDAEKEKKRKIREKTLKKELSIKERLDEFQKSTQNGRNNHSDIEEINQAVDTKEKNIENRSENKHAQSKSLERKQSLIPPSLKGSQTHRPQMPRSQNSEYLIPENLNVNSFKDSRRKSAIIEIAPSQKLLGEKPTPQHKKSAELKKSDTIIIQITKEENLGSTEQIYSKPIEEEKNSLIITKNNTKKHTSKLKASEYSLKSELENEFGDISCENLQTHESEIETKDIETREPSRKVTNKRKDQEILRKRIKETTKFNEFNFHRSKTFTFHKKKNHHASKLIQEFLKKRLERIIKRSKMSKRMAFRLINSIYQSYIIKLKSSDTPQGLLEHSYEELLQKYSLKAVCDKKFLELIASLLQFSSCRRGLMFLKLAGIAEKVQVQSYSHLSINFYMIALNYLLSSKIGIVIALDETSEKVMIPLVRATECVKELFDGKLEKNNLNKLVSKLENSSVKDPKKINQGGLIENELALEIMLEYYENYQKNIVEGASLMIKVIKYKEDVNGILKSELNLMVKNISPNKFKDDDENSEEIIGQDDLINKCLEKNMLGMEDIKSYVLKEENECGEIDIIAQKSKLEGITSKLDKKFKGIDPKVWKDKISNLYEGYYSRDTLESFIAWRIYSNELSGLA